MAFRRRTKENPQAGKSKRRASLESLESRTLLTAVVNGLFEGTNSTTFQWFQPNVDDDIVMRLSVSGNLTAEFIGAIWDPTEPDQLRLADLDEPGAWLFSIYIVAADADCTISMAGVDPDTGEMDPFLDGPQLRTFVQQDLLDTVGTAYIGVQSPEDLADPANNIPFIRSTNERAFGMRPASAGNLYAGVESAPGMGIGRIFIGGTVTGVVDVKTDMIEFFANNILTGTPNGLGAGTTSDIRNNFHIGGDINSLSALTSFGTNTLVTDDVNLLAVAYNTGFQLEIGGRAGWIRAGDSFLGQAIVRHDVTKTGLGLPETEFEFRAPNQPPGGFSYFDPFFVGNDVAVGDLSVAAPDGLFDFNNNDTFDAAQWLGTTRSQELGLKSTIQLRGALNSQLGGPVGNPDNIDFYAVPLLAGQTMQVQLLDENQIGTSAVVRLGIFDPDNRLIYTDYSNVKDGLRAGKRVRIKADRPGAYRVVVARNGDALFNGTGPSSTAFSPYELRISGVGDIALGGLIAENHLATMNIPTVDAGGRPVGGVGLQVLNGDLGEVRAGIVGNGTIFSQSDAWYVPTGNLRAIEAGSLGVTDGTTFFLGTGPDILVRKGKLGLVRNTNPALELALNDNQGAVASLVSDTAIFPNTSSDLTRTPKQLAVGGDIQMIDAAGNLEGALLTNGSIGVIRAGSTGIVGTSFPVWQVNLDTSGSPGVIDLVDVTGNFFSTAITTGPKGNVRNMRVGGTVGRDPFFGGGQPEPTIFAPGRQATLTDDNGTRFTLTGLPRTRNPLFGPGQPEFADAPQLTVVTYPIRDKAGQVIVSVTVTPFDDGIAPTFNGGGGIQIESSSGSGGSVEIGTVNLSGTSSNTLTFDPFTRTYTVAPVVVTVPVFPPVSQRTMEVSIGGSTRVDIWELAAGAGLYDSISNTTGGDIVNITGGPDIISLSGNTIGLAKSSTGVAVEGATVLDSTYPFLQQRNLIQVSDLVAVSARKGLGNIVAANIGTVRPNSDGKNDKNVHEGIEGPIVARHPGAVSELTGNILDVRVGEGMRYSGSGSVGFSGIFADGIIDAVEASGAGNDIRGDIVAGGITNPLIDQPLLDVNGNPVFDAFGNPVLQSTPTFAIGSVSANRGAGFIDSDIMVLGDPVAGVGLFDESREGNATFLFTEVAPDTFDEPINEIEEITVSGNGGILGAFIVAADIGPVAIKSGFGLINSSIFSLADSTVQGVVTDGYGVRDTNIQGGATLNQVIARGKGKRLDTRSFTSAARQSEKSEYDPATGMSLTALDDLHLFLGTTKSSPKRKGVSEAGLITDCQFVGSRELGKVEAFRILARNTTVFDPITGIETPIPPLSLAYPMRISFGNSTNRFVVGDVVDGLSLTTGSLNLFQTGGNVQRTLINVAGRIGTIQTQGALRGSTEIRAIGAEGQIEKVITRKGLFARVNSTLDIGTVSVGTDLGSGSLESSRNIRTLNVKGSILSGASVRARRTLFDLIVGKDIQEGATVKAGAIQNQSIGGQVDGNIVIV